MTWPFKVPDHACLVHQCLTRNSYSINICSMNEESFNSSENCAEQVCAEQQTKPIRKPLLIFLPLHIQKSKNTQRTLCWVKISQWLQSLRLNMIFFKLSSRSQRSLFQLSRSRKNKEKCEETESIYKLLLVLYRTGQNLNFLSSYEPSNLPVLNPTILLPA